MNILPHRGLVWNIEVWTPDRQRVIDRMQRYNKVPIEGLNFLWSLLFKGATAPPALYISAYEGAYTPTDDVTAATLGGLTTEITAYTPTTRPEFVEGAVADGATSNSAQLAEMTFTAEKTVRVLAMSSASAKLSTAGVLFSVVELPSPRTYPVGSILRAFAGPSAVSDN